MNAMFLRIAAFCALGLFATTGAAAELTATITDGTGQPLRGAIVYVSDANAASGNKAKAAKLDQVDKTFVPQVSVVQMGTPIEFPNSDNIRHQVYSFSPAKVFTLKLYSGRPAEPVVFDKPGVVVLGCNIHDTMIAWVLVVDTPWFGKTNAQGRAIIKDIPAGTYELSAWHPGVALPVSGGQIEVKPQETLSRAVKLAVSPVPGLTSP